MEQFEAEQANNPTRSPATSLSADSVRRQPHDPDGPVEPSRNYEYNEEDKPRHSTVAAMSDIFEDDYIPPAAPVRNGGGGGTRPPGLDDPDYDPWNPPADEAPPESNESEAGEPATLWEGYDKPRLEPPTKSKKKGEWTCSQHGSLCTPGICKERGRFERDKRLREEREEREEKTRERNLRREKNQQKRKKKADAIAEGEHSGNVSSSGSSNSDSDSDTSRDQGTVFI